MPFKYMHVTFKFSIHSNSIETFLLTLICILLCFDMLCQSAQTHLMMCCSCLYKMAFDMPIFIVYFNKDFSDHHCYFQSPDHNVLYDLYGSTEGVLYIPKSSICCTLFVTSKEEGKTTTNLCCNVIHFRKICYILADVKLQILWIQTFANSIFSFYGHNHLNSLVS